MSTATAATATECRHLAECQARCPWCKKGIALDARDERGHWWHLFGKLRVYCPASWIREQ